VRSERSRPPAELLLNEYQRRAVGVRLRAIDEAVQTLLRTGVDADELTEIEQLVDELGAAARVSPPPPQTSLVAAMVAEILIAAADIMPSRLRRYGDLEEETARRMETLAGRLTELADALETGVSTRS
jgi:hypothetical protein